VLSKIKLKFVGLGSNQQTLIPKTIPKLIKHQILAGANNS
jgi:hypothetical protein